MKNKILHWENRIYYYTCHSQLKKKKEKEKRLRDVICKMEKFHLD